MNTTNTTQSPLNELVRNNRRAKKMTQQELAQTIRVSQSLISKIEKSPEKTLEFRVVVKLAKLLGFTLQEIDVRSYE